MDLNRSAVDILADLHDRSISAETLLQATFERIDALNPTVNAIVGLADRDDVLAQARALDAGPVRGPLHGLPLAPKDLVNVAGLRSTHGSPIFADLVPDTDDVLAANLRAAGAILIGKTNVPEFGLGSHTFNPVYGRTTNPYDPARTCGGSSGGAGVALALGMLALADGSDMMGSLRNPAAWNNVYGFRPTWGRVAPELSEDGALHQMATRGPMARTPQDLTLLLDVLSGPDPLRAEMAAPEPLLPGLQAFAAAGTDLSGMRIGWLGDWGGAFPCEPGILEVSADALDVLRGLGAVVDD
ncbi:MAG: amidase, partial [Alphaproteobacteria bacterium]|nr:amidase [Alphaproteobacteria bacterium]